MASKKQIADKHNLDRWLSQNARIVEPRKPVSKEAMDKARMILAIGAGLSAGSPRSFFL